MKTFLTAALLIFCYNFAIAQVQCCKDHLTHVPDHENAMHSNDGSKDAFSYIRNLPAESLSAEEKAALLQIREEELLAHDLYVTLYDAWGIRIFNNIAGSESRHASAIKVLLDKYNIPDPAADHNPGHYHDNQLQVLYDSLLGKGLQSYEAALRTGAFAEETDIEDLQAFLDNTIDNHDIYVVFSNLKRASENHLRAFARQLNNRGVAYTPSLLNEAQFSNIVNRMAP